MTLTPLRRIGIVGSRSLGSTHKPHIRALMTQLHHRGYTFATGGAIGADQYCVEAALRLGLCPQVTIVSPWKYISCFPVVVRAMISQFKQYGGQVNWGHCTNHAHHLVLRAALLERSIKLVGQCSGLIAFLDGHTNGTIFTIKQALKHKKKVVVFPINCEPPAIPSISWKPFRCGANWEGGYLAQLEGRSWSR